MCCAQGGGGGKEKEGQIEVGVEESKLDLPFFSPFSAGGTRIFFSSKVFLPTCFFSRTEVASMKQKKIEFPTSLYVFPPLFLWPLFPLSQMPITIPCGFHRLEKRRMQKQSDT